MQFDLNAWGYTQEDVRMLLGNLVSKGFNLEFHRWQRDGGKYLSLAVSNALCKVINDPDMSVPPWVPIPIHCGASSLSTWLRDHALFFQSDWYKKHHASVQGFILRSSSSEEDWLDARSGVHESFESEGLGDLDEVAKDCFERSPHLAMMLQHRIKGVGVVMDIGYSHLFEQVVVRLAVGNPTQGNYRDPVSYTSPTWDQRANIALFDRMGNVLIPYTSYAPFGEIIQATASRIPKIIGGLESLNIDFGVELELIVDPKHSNVWHLVQVRPTPEMLRGCTQIKPIPEGFEFLAHSLRINQPGTCQGKAVYSDNRPDDYNGYPLSHLCDTFGKSRLEESLSEREGSLLKGQILFWNEGAMSHDTSFTSLRGAGLMGAAGQVTYKWTFGNFAHGCHLKIGKFQRPFFEDGRRRGIILGLPSQAYKTILYRLRKNQPTELFLRSDGLVGQAFWKTS